MHRFSNTNIREGAQVQPLLDYLTANALPSEGAWEAWEFRRVPGGANNLLYRATHVLGNCCAVKFTLRDSRRRAEREYSALAALDRAGLHIAPQALWHEADRYAQPVVVQSWLEGDVATTPPTNDAEWRSLMEHYAALHTLTPDKTDLELLPASLNADGVAACVALVQQQADRLPPDARPDSFSAMLRWLEGQSRQDWPRGPVALCRVDANINNFLRRPGAWASVDWENSGWGDPAFEIADLRTHPAYQGVSDERWETVTDTYCVLRAGADPTAFQRIPLYVNVMLFFWTLRLARMLYEIPRGLDQRLAERPPDWEADAQRKYRSYLQRAEQVLEEGV